MKRFLILLTTLFCTVAFADTITINWLNEDKTVSATSSCTIGGDVVLPNNIPQKRGYTFKGYVDNYTPVEYIESNGSQYINTNYKATANTRIRAKMYVVNKKNATGFFGGTEDYPGHLVFGYKNNTITFVRGIDSYNINKILNNGDILEIDWNNFSVGFNINNTEYNTSLSDSGYGPKTTIYLFKAGGDYNVFAIMKLYYFQIYNGDVLVRDFIPVVDSKGVACLYDRIEHKFYYNAGSGEFIAGPTI